MSDHAQSSPGVLRETPGTAALTTWSARIAGAVAILIGGFWLTAWLVGLAAQWSAAGTIIVKTNMALCQLLAGLALWQLAGGRRPPLQLRRVAGAALALVVLIIGALTLSEHLFGWDLGIDQLLATEAPGAAATASPNRMGPPGSLSLFLLGAGLLALAWGRRAVVPYLGLAACLINLLPMVGYLYGIEKFFLQPRLTGIAWPTVVALFLLGMGLVLAVRETGPMTRLLREDAGGVLLRRLLPMTLLVPLALGFLKMKAEQRGWFDAETRTGLLIVTLVVVFSAILWRTSARLSRSTAAEADAQSALRMSEEQFRALYEQAPLGIARIDSTTGRFLLINPTYCRILQRTEAEALPLDFQSVTHPDDLAPDLENMQRLRDGLCRSFEMDKRYLRPDGSVVWVSLTVVPEWAEGQPPSTHVAMVTDITARKQTEAAVRTSEERFRALFENMQAGCAHCQMVFDDAGRPVDFIYRAVNSAFGRLTGLQNVVGQSITELLPGIREAHPELFEIYGSVARSGQPAQFEFEFKPLSKWLIVSAYQTQPGHFAAVFDDITARKRAEDARRESEERLRLATQAANIGAFDWNIQTGVNVWTPELEAMYGLACGEFGKTQPAWEQLVHPEDRAAALGAVEQTFATGQTVEREWRVVWRDGSVHWIAGRFQGFKDASGKPMRLSGVNINITARKQAEEQLRESDARLREANAALRQRIAQEETANNALREARRAAVNLMTDAVASRERAVQAGAALRASEERLRLAIEAADFGTWDLDLVTGHALRSLRHDQIFGYREPQQEWSLDIALSHILPEDRQKIQEAHTPAPGKDAMYVEARTRRADGGMGWIMSTGRFHYDAQGRALRIIGVCADITARKQAEEALRQSREDLERAQTVGQVGSWRLDTRRNSLTWSDENHRIFGLPKGAPMSYETFLSTIHPDDRQYVDRQWQAGMRGAPYDIEHRIVVGGQVKWVREKAYLEFDETGALRGGFGITQDITERKRAEDATRASEARFSAIIRTAMDAIITLDQDQRIILFNAAAEEIFRCSAAEAIGQPLDRFIPERYRESHRTHIENFGKTGVTARSMGSQKRLVGQRADGELFPFEATMSQAETAGQKLYTVILRDISEREKAEQSLRKAEAERVRAEQANEAKAAFLANISHELRTPLNAILGFSRLVRNAPDVPAEQIRHLDIINRSGEHLLNLINNVLDMSRIESGHMELKEVGSDLGQMLQEVQSLLQVQAAEKGLVLVAQRAPALPRQVGVDADKLRQVLINLVANAIKFSTRGNVILRARVSRQEPPQTAWVRFEVEDAGPGISEQDRKRIFSPFVQLGEQPRTDAGTGLGLAISRRYIELMGGQVDVVSKPGKGSVFYFEIPVHLIIQSGRDSGDMQHGHVVALAPGQPTYRLLIAEDQAENRLLLRMMLEPLGFELREAKDGQEAMALFEQWRPHLIWMDIGMPKTDGLQVTRQIRACAAGASTKVVAVTAHVFEDERRKILAAGCDGFIRKPYRETEIFDALKEHLGVRFLYAEERPSTAAAKGGKVSVAQLAELPPELLETLRDAAVLLDTQRCLDLVAKVKRIDVELGANMQRILNNLQFSELIQVLDNAIATRPA